MIGSVGVVVPAHNEEEMLPACLASVRRAAARLGARPVHVVVAADACTDRTAQVARAGGATVLELAVRSVGAARAAGVARVLALMPAAAPSALWLATTDADSVVPPGWLARQIRHARQGWDAVVGTVRVRDWSGHPGHLAERFAAHYAHGEGPHPHVHGANLGCTAAAYLAAGGFQGLRTAEDHALVCALGAAGQKILRTTANPVVTSARPQARAPQGFSHLLASLS